MAKRSAISVRVVDSNGLPVAGAVVAVEQGDAPFPEVAYQSDADGRVSITLPPGHFRIGARGGKTSYGAVDVRHGKQPGKAVIRLAP